MSRSLFLVTALAAGLLFYPAAVSGPGTAWAAASGGGTTKSSASGSGSIDEAKSKIEAQNYRGAVALLEDILEGSPNSADALNLLGYSHRKLGNKEKALAYYTKALDVDPKHVGANEYLGELYLEMKDLAKAEERLAVLKSACSSCEEYEELKDAIADFKATQG